MRAANAQIQISGRQVTGSVDIGTRVLTCIGEPAGALSDDETSISITALSEQSPLF